MGVVKPRSLIVRPGAFTLLEMLVALSVFSLVAAMAYAGLARLVETRRALAIEQEQLARVLFALGLFERDLRAALPRSARDAKGATRPALVGGSAGIEWTRAAPRAGGGASVGRVRYRLDGSRLLIEWDAVADRAPDSPASSEVLLERVSRLELRFLDREGRWQRDWPAGEAALPRAVEVVLGIEGLGDLRRLVAVEGAR